MGIKILQDRPISHRKLVLGIFIYVVWREINKRLEKGQSRDEVAYDVLYPDGQGFSELPAEKQVGSVDTYSEEGDEAEEVTSS